MTPCNDWWMENKINIQFDAVLYHILVNFSIPKAFLSASTSTAGKDPAAPVNDSYAKFDETREIGGYCFGSNYWTSRHAN